MTKRQLLAFAKHFTVASTETDLFVFSPESLTRMFRAYDDTQTRANDTKPQEATLEDVIDGTLFGSAL